MKEFEAKKSAWGAVSFWSIVLCIFIIPIFVLILRIYAYKKETITFYKDKIVVKKGLINVSEKTFAFTGVFSVDVSQSLSGRLFNYGNLDIDFVGRNDINTKYIKDPIGLKNYLETKIVQRNAIHTFMN